jgi:hypothetical protein
MPDDKDKAGLPPELQAEIERARREIPTEVQAELDRLRQSNDDLKRVNRDLRGDKAKVEDALEAAKHQRASGKGAGYPEIGTAICYVRGRETMHRRGTIGQLGFEEIRTPGGPQTCAHLLYCDPGPPAPDQKDHTFEVTRPWDPSGGPETWHLAKDCPVQGDPAHCPYAKPAAKKPAGPQAP